MQTTRRVFRWTGLMIVVASSWALLGCDVDTDSAASNDLRIEPANVSMKKGQSQVFTAIGGYDYKWSVDDDSVGVLNPRTGERTTYTVLNSATTGSVVTITVTSFIEGSQSSVTTGTNGTSVATSYQATAAAIVLLQ